MICRIIFQETLMIQRSQRLGNLRSMLLDFKAIKYDCHQMHYMSYFGASGALDQRSSPLPSKRKSGLLLTSGDCTSDFVSKRFLQCRIENNVVHSPFPDVDIPRMPLGQYIMDSFAAHGNKIAVVCAHTNHSYKYREMTEYCKRFGSALIKRGLKPGDVLCIHSENLPEYLIAVVGALAVGAIVTPADPRYTVNELSRELEETNAKLLLCGTECLHVGLSAAKDENIENVMCFGYKKGAIPFKEMLSDDGSMYKLHTDVDIYNDPAFIMHSSGTTGLPKATLLTHYNVIANLQQHQTECQHRVQEDSSTLGILPFYHGFGLFVTLLNYAVHGGKNVTMKKFEPELFLKKVKNLNVTRLNLVPSMVHFLCTSPLAKNYNLSSVRSLVAGAAPLPLSVLGTLHKILPNAVITQGFGMTELSPVSHNHPTGGVDIASIGYPVSRTECKVIDCHSGESLGVGESGEMLVRGPQVMKGYLNNVKQTKETITEDGWLHTGDLAYYDKEGKFYVVGRLKELIKYKGQQVSPAEIEQTLIEHPAIVDIGVFGIPDDVAGEVPAALIVLSDTYKDFSKEDVQKILQEKLAEHKHLRGGIEFVDDVPRNSIGKLLRNECIQLLTSMA